MYLDEYQSQAGSTKVYPKSAAIMYPALALNEEAGEVAGKIGKALRDGTPIPRDEVEKELGDVLWQLAALCGDLGLSLDAVAQKNLKKLEDRAKRGVLGGSGDNR